MEKEIKIPFRNFDCPSYDDCLLSVAKQNTLTFTCNPCCGRTDNVISLPVKKQKAYYRDSAQFKCTPEIAERFIVCQKECKSKDISLRKIIIISGVNGREIDNVKNCKGRMGFNKWVALSQALGVVVEYLLYGTFPRLLAYREGIAEEWKKVQSEPIEDEMMGMNGIEHG